MEDNKEKTTETTTTASVTVTDSSKENDSSVNMSVSSPTSNDVKKEETYDTNVVRPQVLKINQVHSNKVFNVEGAYDEEPEQINN
jgi:copper oxidase (laccase) domain-containing protein